MGKILRLTGIVIYPVSTGVQILGDHTILVSEISNVVHPEDCNYLLVCLKSGVIIQSDDLTSPELLRVMSTIFPLI